MSQAHRPTWNPTLGRETKSGSAQVSKWGLASQTKLKFRQPGQTSTSDVARRDLRAELAAAERRADDRKRKAAGLLPSGGDDEDESGHNEDRRPVAAIGNGSALGDRNGATEADGEDEERAKRRRVLEEIALDADDSDDEEVADKGKGKGKARAEAENSEDDDGDDDDDEEDEDEDEDDDDDDDDSDEDDTAALMAELARIKQERAEEKARLEAADTAAAKADRDEEIARGNPLLNLQAALGQGPSASSGSGSGAGGFAVKRRWDDDLVFKNQASGVDDKPKKGEFVNDLLRSEFHRKFMNKFIK